MEDSKTANVTGLTANCFHRRHGAAFNLRRRETWRMRLSMWTHCRTDCGILAVAQCWKTASYSRCPEPGLLMPLWLGAWRPCPVCWGASAAVSMYRYLGGGGNGMWPRAALWPVWRQTVQPLRSRFPLFPASFVSHILDPPFPKFPVFKSRANNMSLLREATPARSNDRDVVCHLRVSCRRCPTRSRRGRGKMPLPPTT